MKCIGPTISKADVKHWKDEVLFCPELEEFSQFLDGQDDILFYRGVSDKALATVRILTSYDCTVSHSRVLRQQSFNLSRLNAVASYFYLFIRAPYVLDQPIL